MRAQRTARRWLRPKLYRVCANHDSRFCCCCVCFRLLPSTENARLIVHVLRRCARCTAAKSLARLSLALRHIHPHPTQADPHRTPPSCCRMRLSYAEKPTPVTGRIERLFLKLGAAARRMRALPGCPAARRTSRVVRALGRQTDALFRLSSFCKRPVSPTYCQSFFAQASPQRSSA
jgi:hypothetical protein